MRVRLKRDIRCFEHVNLKKDTIGEVLGFRYVDGRWGDGDEVIFTVIIPGHTRPYYIGAHALESI